MTVDRGAKAMRIVLGLMLMSAFVLILFGLLSRYAGQWGVPYFSYVSANGSPCTNNLTGYTCDPLTAADVGFYTDTELPADTQVVAARYHATHDWQLTATLRVPKQSAGAAWQALAGEFGTCQPNHPPPISTQGLTSYCTLANDLSVTQSGTPPGRVFVIGTGIRADGVRVISMNVRSR